MSELKPGQAKAFILANTALIAPPHVPEIRLHLAEESHALWLKTEEELAEIGLPPPFWAFAWAGGQGLARYILDHPETVRGKSVLDFATGSGLVAIAAARAGAKAVTACDIDPFCADALALNADANAVAVAFAADDLIGMDEGWDAVLAGDVFYAKDFADALLPWFERLTARGATVLVGDPGRSYLPKDALDQIAEEQVLLIVLLLLDGGSRLWPAFAQQIDEVSIQDVPISNHSRGGDGRAGGMDARLVLLALRFAIIGQRELLHQQRQREALHDERGDDDTEGEEDDEIALRKGRAAEHLGEAALAQFAAEKAGVGNDKIDVAELHAPFTHQHQLLVEALGLGDNVSINPSGGALAANPMMAAGLLRLGEVANRIMAGEVDRGVATATSGHLLQQNLVAVLEGA